MLLGRLPHRYSVHMVVLPAPEPEEGCLQGAARVYEIGKPGVVGFD